MRCPPVCPTGALRPITAMTEAGMGLAWLDKSRCYTYEGSVLCKTCHEKCPLRNVAIIMDMGMFPVITKACVGCGVCEKVCPRQAIVTVPKANARGINSISGNYLVVEILGVPLAAIGLAVIGLFGLPPLLNLLSMPASYSRLWQYAALGGVFVPVGPGVVPNPHLPEGERVLAPAAPLLASRERSQRTLATTYGIIWFVGLLGIGGSTFEISRRREKAEALSRMKSRFLANMSHDMRPP